MNMKHAIAPVVLIGFFISPFSISLSNANPVEGERLKLAQVTSIKPFQERRVVDSQAKKITHPRE